MKKLILILFILLAPTLAFGQTCDFWVDSGATGNNDGSSETDAWEAFSDITWSEVQTEITTDEAVVCFARDATWTSERLTIGAYGTGQTRRVILQPYGTGALPRISNGKTLDCMRAISMEYVTIDGFHIYQGLDGINLEGTSDNATIKNTHFEDNSIYTAHPLVDDVTIDNCTFTGADTTSVYNTGDRLVVKNSRFVSGTTDAIFSTGCDGLIVEDNIFSTDLSDDAVYSYGSTNGIVRRNFFNGVGATAVWLRESSDTKIYNNIIINSGGRDIYVHASGTTGTLIYANTFFNNTTVQVQAGLSTATTIMNNVFYQNGSGQFWDLTTSELVGSTINYNDYYWVGDGDGDGGDHWVTTTGRTWTEMTGEGHEANGTYDDPEFSDNASDPPELWVTATLATGSDITGTEYDDRLDQSSSWPDSVSVTTQATQMGAYYYGASGGTAGSVIKWENAKWENACWGDCP